MEFAPYRADLAEGPEDVQAVWVMADDGAQLRAVVWPAARARATVLLFPGRTEYAEKYGRIARDLTGAGLSVGAIDWRGQGFSDRLVDDRLLGHVMHFTDYQRDVAALLGLVDAIALPKPRLLLAHSMGGCIGLRSLIEGLPVARAVFSAPMWGIQMAPKERRLAAILPTLARLSGQGQRYTPGSQPVDFDSDEGFAANPLTTDPDHFAYMSRQIRTEDAFRLGGPSLHWLSEALREAKALRAAHRPGVPALTFVGTDESVVAMDDIEFVHETWETAELRKIEGARHELMMESPPMRGRFIREALAFFAG